MSEKENENFDFLKGFSMSPDWTRKPAKSPDLRKFERQEREDDDRPPRFSRGDKGSRNDSRPFGKRRDFDRRDGERRPHDRPFRDRDGSGRGEYRAQAGGEGRPRAFSGPGSAESRERGDRRRPGGNFGGERRFPRDFQRQRVDYPYEVRLLPEGGALSMLVRKVHSDHRAFPIVELAKLVAGNTASCDVRVEVKQPDQAKIDAAGEDAAKLAEIQKQRSSRIYQCTRCGFIADSDEAIRAHALEKHFGEEFASEEITVDPPSGTFPCVAKCDLNGRLIAPPNHHSFNQRLQEIHHSDYPMMPESEFRRHVVNVHDAEAVEQWKQEASKKTVFTRVEKPVEGAKPAKKGAKAAHAVVKLADAGEAQPEDAGVKPAEAGEPRPEAPVESPPVDVGSAPAEKEAPAAETAPVAPAQEREASADEPAVGKEPPKKLDRPEAEAIFNKEVVPGLVSSARHVVCKLDIGLAAKGMLGEAIRHTYNREKNRPFSTAIALRGAFKHKQLHIFKAADKDMTEFVIFAAPSAIDVEHAIPELKAVIEYIQQHEGTTKAELLAGLGVPTEGELTDSQKEIIKQLAWTTERSIIIEYANGTLALPQKDRRPFYRQAKPADRPKAKPEDKPAKDLERPGQGKADPAEKAGPVKATEPAGEPGSKAKPDDAGKAEPAQEPEPGTEPAPAAEVAAAAAEAAPAENAERPTAEDK